MLTQMDNRRRRAKMAEEIRGYKESSDRFLSESPGISFDFPCSVTSPLMRLSKGLFK